VLAALAELVTFVLLDSVYQDVEVDPAPGTGSRTDFAVDVPARTHFEVHRTTIPASTAGDAQRQAGLAAELEKIDSPDFWLSADVQSGPQVPAMGRVRQEAETWLASLDQDTEVRRSSDEQQARHARAAVLLQGGLGAAERPHGHTAAAWSWLVGDDLDRPAVDTVQAIGIQLYSDTNAPLLVAIDEVRW